MREFTHEEFVTLLERYFPTVEPLLQHNWIASAILDRDSAADASGEVPLEVDLRKLAGVEQGAELYTVAVCGARGAQISTGGVMVTASVDESHQLARRLLEAEAHRAQLARRVQGSGAPGQALARGVRARAGLARRRAGSARRGLQVAVMAAHASPPDSQPAGEG